MDDIVTFTEARKNLSALMDRSIENHEIIAITRGNREPIVMMPLSDFRGYAETDYLLSTESNRKAMYEALDEVQTGKTFRVEWDEESESYKKVDA